MRHLLATLGLACLGGCALSPADLRTQGEIALEHRSRLIASAAATCVAEKVADSQHFLSTQMRAGADPQVYVYGMGNLWAIAMITTNGSGSVITVRTQSALVGFERDWITEPIRGC